MAFQIKNGVLKKYTEEPGVTIPEGVASIGDWAFDGCDGLADASGLVVVNGMVHWCRRDVVVVTIPEGVTSIGDEAFNECKSLTSVIIPESVTSIGNRAFAGCESLTSITIPESVTSIGREVFAGCKGLADASGLVVVNGTAYLCWLNGTDVTIPEGVTSIGDWAFACCRSLTGVTIPEGVASIGKGAFWMCERMASVTIPDSVTRIREWAFAECGISALSLPKALLGQLNFQIAPDSNFSLVLRDGGRYSFLAYSSKKSSDNLRDFFATEAYQQYDLELLGDGSVYRYKLPTRLLGMLGRLEDPVDLAEDIREAFGELLKKNAKKLLPLAEELRCPEIIRALLRSGVLDAGKETALRELLAKSPVPEIAALAEWKAEGGAKAAPKPGKERKPLSEGEILVDRLLREEGRTPEDAVKTLYQLYSVKPIVSSYLPEVRCKDGSLADAAVLTYLFTVHEKLEDMTNVRDRTLPDVIASYETPGVCPHAAEVLSLLDQESLQEGLLTLADRYLGWSERTKQMFLAYPICRYADEATMQELTKRAPRWASKRSKDEAPHLRTFRAAVRYSETRSAMLFAEKYHDLDKYAAIRGTTADAVRDQYLSDIGLDERGGRQYDLGNQTVTARLQPDLSFLVELPGGKTAKSLPKKGAGPEKYEAAKEDLDQRKKDAKRIVKARGKVLFEDFLSGRERGAADWQAAYLHNPLLRSVAKLLVWSQGKSTFTLTDSGAIRSDGQAYQLGQGGIRVAHPMEMTPGDVSAWQEYFRENGLKQPFEQIWEPAYDPAKVREDRYKGCAISYRRAQNAEKHGIHYYDEDFHNWVYFTLGDCQLENELTNSGRHELYDDTTFTLGKFTFRKYTRKVNHIVYLFDKWTIWERIQKDDIDVMKLLDRYNAAQITEFLNIAAEYHATNLTAALLEYKHTRFPAYDAFAEFTLDD